MKTTRLEKSIEVSKKRIADYDKKIEMYRGRFERNNVLGLNLGELRTDYDATRATYLAIKEHNETVMRGWRAKYEEKYGKDGWYEYCKIDNHADYYIENNYKRANERLNLAHLESELNAAHQANKAEQDRKDSLSGLRDVLENLMAEYKKEWFADMRYRHSQAYDYCWLHKDRWNEWIDRMIHINSRWYIELYRKHEKLNKKLREKYNDYRKRLCRRELTFDNKDEYMVEVERDLNYIWNQNLDKLTDKCDSFNIDIEHLQADEPELWGKGFSVVLTDGKPRLVDVRTIWAAEHSVLVIPHTRYIVTERKLKGGA